LLTLSPTGSDSAVKEKETYLVSLPPLHIENLIYGAPFVELGKFIHIASSTGYIAKIDFSGRGWLSGKKNTFSATLWKDGEGSESSPLFSADGQWSETFTLKQGNGKRAKEIETFSPSDIKLSRLVVSPVEEQDVFESRRAWAWVSKAIQKGDMDQTSHYKSRIENGQRALRRKEQDEKREWKRVFFSTVSAKDEGEQAFQKLVKMLTGPSVGLSAWDGVGADKTAGVWRFDEKKAGEAERPFHEEGLRALGEKEDGSGSAPVSRTTTLESEPGDGAGT
jgi:hypothetical protein